VKKYNVRVFEQHAREYDSWFDAHAYAYESEVSAVRSLLPQGSTGLEVGVGTGRFASRLGINVGVEPAHAMASTARRRGIEVYETGGEALPFTDGSFDFGLMVTAICFFSDPIQALRDAGRVLKPLGYIVIGMIDKDSPLGKSYEANKRKSTFYRYAHFHAVTEVINWLIHAGFGSIKTCQTIFKLPVEMTATEPVKTGHGEGGFVVIAAQKEVKT
jgi:SAM-dependent methyltransferase